MQLQTCVVCFPSGGIYVLIKNCERVRFVDFWGNNVSDLRGGGTICDTVVLFLLLFFLGQIFARRLYVLAVGEIKGVLL